MNLDGLISQLGATNLAGYWDTRYATKPPLAGAAIFPETKIVGDRLSYFYGKQGAAKIMKMGAYDANVPMRGRIGFNRFDNEMPMFREGAMLGEKDRRDIVMLMQANSPDLATFIQNIFDDRTNLILGAQVSAERMRMQALSSLAIDMESNGVIYKATYGDVGTQKTQVTTKWSDYANSKPLEDIAAIKKLLHLSQVVAYCSYTTFCWLLQNASIKGSMLAAMSQYTSIISEQALRQWIATNFGCTFVVFDDVANQYTDESGATQQFFPDGIVTFGPVGTLGETVYGTTPEETSLWMDPGRKSVETSVVNTGIAVTTKYDADTVNFETIVSAVVLPRFTLVDYVHILDVNPA